MAGDNRRESPLASCDSGPTVPDYPRLRAELERGAYPFLPEDEGELFGRCEWLEAENVYLRNEVTRLRVVEEMWADGV